MRVIGYGFNRSLLENTCFTVQTQKVQQQTHAAADSTKVAVEGAKDAVAGAIGGVESQIQSAVGGAVQQVVLHNYL